MGKIPSFDTMEFSWNTDNIIIFPKGMMQIKNTIPYLTNIQDSLPHVFMRFFVFLIAVVLLTGCTHKIFSQPKEGVVTTTQNSTATSTVDTSDWLTYENKEYGFSFRYPGGWEIDQEVPYSAHFDSNGPLGSVTVYIQEHDSAPEEDGWLYSRRTLESLQMSIDANPDIIINGISIRTSVDWDVPGSEFYKKAEFFIKDNYVVISYPMRVSFPTNYVWPDEQIFIDQRINQIVKGGASDIVNFQIKIFDQIVDSIFPVPLTDDLSAWRTSYDHKYGFSFRYPHDYMILDSSPFSFFPEMGNQVLYLQLLKDGGGEFPEFNIIVMRDDLLSVVNIIKKIDPTGYETISEGFIDIAGNKYYRVMQSQALEAITVYYLKEYGEYTLAWIMDESVDTDLENFLLMYTTFPR